MNMRVVLIMAAVAAVLAVDGAFAFPRGRMPRPKPGASTAELDAYLSARAHPPRPLGRIAPEGVVPVPQVHGRPSLPHAKLAVGAADPHASTGSFNVMDYGAKSDCTFSSSSDTTSAFQAALDAAGAANGGVVYAPPGCYVFAGSLVVPPAVALQGSYETVPAHSILGGPPPTNGSVLAPTGGRGSDSGPAFITLPEDAGLAGFSIFYPTQEQVQTPVPFPWTVHMVGMNSFVTDVELLLSWNGINATQAHRHYIARVQGQPINIGVLVDATYDIGRIEDVHFNPWASNKQPFMSYQLTHGRAFVFGRSDWEYVFNTFAFGYAIGYHFIHTATGDMNANLLGIGADLAINASVKVDASQAPGLLITNGEFTAFSTPQWLPNSTAQSTQVVVAATNTGPVKFSDSSFWGPDSQIAMINGSGTTSFSNCEFVQWDLQSKGPRAAIRAFDGSLILQGNDFAMKGQQLELGSGVKKAAITGNIFAGPKSWSVANGVNAQEAANAFDPSGAEEL